MQNDYGYDVRNRFYSVDNSEKLFEYENEYFKNSNVKSMDISRDYRLNFANQIDLASAFSIKV